MAVTIHQAESLGLLKSSEENDRQSQHRHKNSCHMLWKDFSADPSQCRDCRNSKVSSIYPASKHKFTLDSLWVDGCLNPFWVLEEPTIRVLAFSIHAQDAQLCYFSHKSIHSESTAHHVVPCNTMHMASCDDSSSLIALLKICTKNKDLVRGTSIHDDIMKRGLLEKCCDALVAMYAKCGALAKAKELLDMHGSRDVFAWTALISGYFREGQSRDALKCFERMRREGPPPDAVTFTCILRACGTLGAVDKGKQIHDEIAKQGLLVNNIVLGNALVDMYAKCGVLAKAQLVLEELPSRDIVSWNALITGYVQQGQGEQALKCFERMQGDGFSPNAVTYVCILKACGILRTIEKGERIHDEIRRKGLLADNIVLGNALVDMYAKCGVLAKARHVLEELPSRNVVSWSALIAGYAQQGQGNQALKCFEIMQREGITPNTVTFACILKACGILGAADKGKQIHDEISRQGLLRNNIVLGNALVDMYAKCGALAKAQLVFQELPSRDVVSWNALISGYAQQGQGKQALNCFQQMQQDGLSPDAVTFACVLKSCGTLGAAEMGSKIHDEISKQGLLKNDVVLGSALVDMYAKCGALAKAQHVLEELPSRNVISWSALIAGYAQQGQGEQALNCFESMQREGILPNAVTYIGIMNACGALEDTDKGKQFHEEIVKQGWLQNNVVLGNAVVDMYVKCGALTKAHEVFEDLPSRDVISWNALIAGYAQQGRGEQALNCFECMQQEGILPDAVTFACVLNVCSHLGRVEDGCRHFVDMKGKYGVKPDLEVYICMIDLFGRAGHLEKAVEVIQEMPTSDYTAVWHCLLGACLKWGDIKVGRWAFEQAVQIDKTDGPAYVYMANIYAAAGMKENAKDIEALRMENKT